jgi:hypothetical protein
MIDICEDCDQEATWLSESGDQYCDYHAASVLLESLSGSKRDELVVGVYGYRPPPPPAWKLTKPRGHHEGWLVLIGPYDDDFIADIKKIEAGHRRWVPQLRAWFVHESVEERVQRIIRRHS